MPGRGSLNFLIASLISVAALTGQASTPRARTPAASPIAAIGPGAKRSSAQY